jgi:hypothetical protein
MGDSVFMALYTRDEIKAYIDKHLHIVGAKSVAAAEQIKAHFADTIELLPPFQQSILIETRRGNIAGDREEIKVLYGEDINVNGFFNPGALKSEFNKASEDMIAFVSEPGNKGRGPSGIITARHEFGHRSDYLVGKLQGAADYWSAKSQSWAEALKKDLALNLAQNPQKYQITEKNQKNPSRWIKRQLESFAAREQVKLYEDERELADHLSYSKDDDKTIVLESFAELSNHYMSLYADKRGDKTAVEAALGKKYPHMWGIFKKEFLPQAQSYANELQTKRHNEINAYLKCALMTAEKAGLDCDQHEARRQAGLYAAAGTLESETKKLARLAALYENPVKHYIEAAEHYARTRYELINHTLKGFEFDTHRARLEGQDLLDTKGADAMVYTHSQLVKSQKALSRYDYRVNYFESALDRAIGDTSGAPDGRQIIERFENLLQSGGLEAAEAEIKALSVPAKNIKIYVNAFDALDEESWYLLYYDDPAAGKQNPLKKDNQALRAQIREIALQGEGALSDAGLALIEEKSLLKQYARAHHKLENSIGSALGGELTLYEGRIILEDFKTLFNKGGADAVHKEIETLSVPQAVIKNYVRSRELNFTAHYEIKKYPDGDISYSQKGGLLKPLHPDLREAPESFEEDIADEIMDILRSKGQAGLVHAARAIEKDTHEALAGVLGKNMPFPDDRGAMPAAQHIPDIFQSAWQERASGAQAERRDKEPVQKDEKAARPDISSP